MLTLQEILEELALAVSNKKKDQTLEVLNKFNTFFNHAFKPNFETFGTATTVNDLIERINKYCSSNIDNDNRELNEIKIMFENKTNLNLLTLALHLKNKYLELSANSWSLFSILERKLNQHVTEHELRFIEENDLYKIPNPPAINQKNNPQLLAKTILVAVGDCSDGFGDFLFAFKLARALKQKHAEKNVDATIYIVTGKFGVSMVEDTKADFEFNIPVIAPEDLQPIVKSLEKKGQKIDIIIEAAAFSTDLITQINSHLKENTPLTMITAYSPTAEYMQYCEQLVQDRQLLNNISFQEIIKTGLDKEEAGIFLTDSWTSSCIEKDPFRYLEPGIKTVMGNKREDWQNVMMQYSGDQDAEGSQVDHFINIGLEFYAHNNKNQTFLMVGLSRETQEKSLNNMANKIKAAGFERITFYDIEKEEKKIIYDSGREGKEFKAVYSGPMSHLSMLACADLSGPLIGATGDQFFAEQLSRGDKIIAYETLPHKTNHVKNYCQRLIAASAADPEVSRVQELIHWHGLDESKKLPSNEEYIELGVLLRNQAVLNKITKANKILRENVNIIPFLAKKFQDPKSSFLSDEEKIQAAFNLFESHMQPFQQYLEANKYYCKFYRQEASKGVKTALESFSISNKTPADLRAFKNAYKEAIDIYAITFRKYGDSTICDHLKSVAMALLGVIVTLLTSPAFLIPNSVHNHSKWIQKQHFFAGPETTKSKEVQRSLKETFSLCHATIIGASTYSVT